jgi:hypothetical protein
MMLGQNGVKKDTNQRPAENAREHDQADCGGIHDEPLIFAQSRGLCAFCDMAVTDFLAFFNKKTKLSILDQSPICSLAVIC